MGGKDDDQRSDLDKWVEAQRAEIAKLRDQLLGQRDDLENDLRSWTDDASSTIKGPFERFKGFVDSNFSALSEGFKNFPSNISELKAKMQQEREARREEEREIWRRWTGSEDSPDHIRMQVDRSSAEERQAAEDATYMLLRESYERNKHVPVQKIIDLYRDSEWSFGGLDQYANPMLSFGGACYYKPETVENLPSTARWGWPAPRPQWLSVDWFKRSPYSPIRLEAHPDMSAEGTKWRAAFEDLLSVTLEKPMISEEKIGQRIPHGKPQSTYHGPGLDWMLSLQCRGILPPQLPSLYKPVSLFDGFDEVKRPRTAEFMHNIDQVTSSKSAPMYPLVKRDLNLLIDEVAVESGPETEAKPIHVALAPWQVPSTEQELYEAMPPFCEPTGPWVPAMTGDRYDDQVEAEDALWEALDSGDAETAAKCLDVYYNAHGNVSDLIYESLDDLRGTTTTSPPSSWFPVLNEALRRSSLPESDFFKKEAHSPGTKVLEKADQWSLAEKYKAIELMRRGDAAAGSPLYWDIGLSVDELERRVIAMERMRAQKQKEQEPKFDEPAQPKRPEILSQLTTTQTTRLPDGTVTTKVVLKQRFADGREEEHETVHTTHEQTSVFDEHKSKDVKPQPTKREKNGWFWS